MPSSNSCSLALWDSPSLPLQSLLPTPASPGSSAHSWESPARIPETISPTPTPSPPRHEETRGDRLDPSQQRSLDTLGQAKRQLYPASPPRTPTLTSSLPPLFLALVGRLVSWEVRLWWPRWQLASQEKTVSGLGGRSVPHSRRYKEEAWGQFLLRNPPPLPRTKGAVASLSGIPSPMAHPPLPLSICSACCFSPGTARAAAPADATASRALQALESSNSSLPSQGAQPFPLETTARASGASPLPSLVLTPSTPLWGGTPHRRGRGSKAGETGNVRQAQGCPGRSRLSRGVGDGSRKPLIGAGVACGRGGVTVSTGKDLGPPSAYKGA